MKWIVEKQCFNCCIKHWTGTAGSVVGLQHYYTHPYKTTAPKN